MQGLAVNRASSAILEDISDTPLAQALGRSHRGEWRALADFAALHAQACADGDAVSSRLAAAGLMITGHHFRHFNHMADGVAELEPLRNDSAGLDATQELLALNGLLLGLVFYRPLDPAIDACSARLQALLECGLDVNLTLCAARTLMYQFDVRHQREPALRVQALVSRRMAEPDATPYRQAHWLQLWRVSALCSVQPQLAEQALAQMRELACRHGLREIQFTATLADVETALPRGDIPTARAAIKHAEGLLDPAQLGEMLQLERAKMQLALMRGEADSALHHASRALRLSVELKMPAIMRNIYAVHEALARLMNEDFEGARGTLQDLIGVLPQAYAEELQAMVQGIDAHLAARNNEADAQQRIEALWAGLRQRRSYSLFDDIPKFSAQLCVLALERGIETDFVRSLIGKQQLAAPEDAPALWPWPLRIEALGGFALWRHDEPLFVEGKAPRKPLALLQVLVAHGAFDDGSGIEVERLMEMLWPDPEAGDPKSSFNVALSRLRKWLGVEQALKLSNGRLSLNPRLVWCDVSAFERTAAALQLAVLPHGDASALLQLQLRLCRLYRGALFGGAALESWQVLARERLAMRFTRLVRDAGLCLETSQRWEEALKLYEEGLLQDLRAEPLHHALIRCLLALDRRVEARRALNRCEAVLKAELGLAAGEELLRLFARVDWEQGDQGRP